MDTEVQSDLKDKKALQIFQEDLKDLWEFRDTRDIKVR